jgi:hypothetical protein
MPEMKLQVRLVLKAVVNFSICCLMVGLSACSSNERESVVGIWQQEKEDTLWDTVEFRTDGVFLGHQSFGTVCMKYSWQGDHRLQFVSEGFDTNLFLNYGVNIKGHELCLTNFIIPSKPEVYLYHRLSHAKIGESENDFKDSQIIPLPATAKPDEVVAAFFKKATLPEGKVTQWRILSVSRVVTSRGAPIYVDAETNFGRYGVYLEFDRPQIGVAVLRGWWCRSQKPGVTVPN